MLRNFFGRGDRPARTAANGLYERIVAAARQSRLYADWNVPDTPLGRFEMVTVHMVLFLRRIRGEQGTMAEIGQILTDEFFLDVDHSLRELGIGDMGVPKRIKKLARMFYGRAQSYTQALDDKDVDALAAALMRNVRPEETSWDESRPLAAYMMECDAVLAEQSMADFVAGSVHFTNDPEV